MGGIALKLASLCCFAQRGSQAQASRKLFELDTENFDLDLNIKETSLLTHIKEIMAPDAIELRAELYQLNMYASLCPVVLLRLSQSWLGLCDCHTIVCAAAYAIHEWHRIPQQNPPCTTRLPFRPRLMVTTYFLLCRYKPGDFSKACVDTPRSKYTVSVALTAACSYF